MLSWKLPCEIYSYFCQHRCERTVASWLKICCFGRWLLKRGYICVKFIRRLYDETGLHIFASSCENYFQTPPQDWNFFSQLYMINSIFNVFEPNPFGVWLPVWILNFLLLLFLFSLTKSLIPLICAKLSTFYISTTS